jgi:hypothetical protein
VKPYWNYVQRDKKTKICDACLIYFTVLQQGMKQKKVQCKYNLQKKKSWYFLPGEWIPSFQRKKILDVDTAPVFLNNGASPLFK